MIVKTVILKRGEVIKEEVESSFDDCDKGGELFVGNLYTTISRKMSAGSRIGDVFNDGKKEYYNNYNRMDDCVFKIAHQTLFYGDPTIKIKNIW